MRKEWYKLAIHRLSTITQVEMDNKMPKITGGQQECVKEKVGYVEDWWFIINRLTVNTESAQD